VTIKLGMNFLYRIYIFAFSNCTIESIFYENIIAKVLVAACTDAVRYRTLYWNSKNYCIHVVEHATQFSRF